MIKKFWRKLFWQEVISVDGAQTIYREAAEVEMEQKKYHKIWEIESKKDVEYFAFWKEEGFKTFMIAFGCLLFLICMGSGGCMKGSRDNRDFLHEDARNVQNRIRCGTDHYQREQQIADGLWQISCVNKRGEGRLVFHE